MKIAVTTENEEVFQHFGQSKMFAIFFADNGEITKKVTLDVGESGHAALAGFLKNLAIDAVICGGIGAGAREALASQGIQLVSGITGSVDKAAEAFVKGELKDQGNICDHHDHEHGHDHDCHGHGHDHSHDHSHSHDCSCHAPMKIRVKKAEQ